MISIRASRTQYVSSNVVGSGALGLGVRVALIRCTVWRSMTAMVLPTINGWRGPDGEGRRRGPRYESNRGRGGAVGVALVRGARERV